MATITKASGTIVPALGDRQEVVLGTIVPITIPVRWNHLQITLGAMDNFLSGCDMIKALQPRQLSTQCPTYWL